MRLSGSVTAYGLAYMMVVLGIIDPTWVVVVVHLVIGAALAAVSRVDGDA